MGIFSRRWISEISNNVVVLSNNDLVLLNNGIVLTNIVIDLTLYGVFRPLRTY